MTVGEVIAFLRCEAEGAREVRADPHPSPTRPAALPATTTCVPATVATSRCTPDAVGVVMAIISDKTGYESDMVSAEMDLESDLGIDSIKRVEILGAAQETLGIKVRDLDALGRTKTVGEVIAFLRRETEGAREVRAEPAPSYNAAPLAEAYNAATNGSSASELLHTSLARPTALPTATPYVPTTAGTTHRTPDAVGVVMAIISDKTGYESDMVSAEMDLESDLGIDSIKR